MMYVKNSFSKLFFSDDVFIDFDLLISFLVVVLLLFFLLGIVHIYLDRKKTIEKGDSDFIYFFTGKFMRAVSLLFITCYSLLFYAFNDQNFLRVSYYKYTAPEWIEELEFNKSEIKLINKKEIILIISAFLITFILFFILNYLFLKQEYNLSFGFFYFSLIISFVVAVVFYLLNLKNISYGSNGLCTLLNYWSVSGLMSEENNCGSYFVKLFVYYKKWFYVSVACIFFFIWLFFYRVKQFQEKKKSIKKELI